MSLIFYLLLLCGLVRADYYTTASEMENLLWLERELSSTFLEYYKSRVRKLDELERFLDGLDQEVEVDFSHPTNSYLLIKRFVQKWTNIGQFGHDEKAKTDVEMLIAQTDSIKEFDDRYELQGAVFAIMKTQEIYNVKVSDYANNFGGNAHNLTPEDILDIGKDAQSLNYFQLATMWLEEALKYYKNNEKDKLPSIYEYLAWTTYQSGELEAAIDYTQNHLDLVTDSTMAAWNLWHYKRELVASFSDPTIRKDPTVHEKPWNKRHKILCRHEEKVPKMVKKTLFCDYYAPHYQFYLKPMKREIEYNEPNLVIFHDMILPREINHLKKVARNKLSTAHVYSMIDGRRITANYRISKNTWIDDKSDIVVANIIRRAGALLNLDMRYSEPLQVANYGIGGNYEPHFDFATPPHNSSIFGDYGKHGNRMATMLIYLTDVEKGGDTVFTTTGHGLIATPKKGSAAFWYNLKRSGEGDYKTKHGACPILFGEKWVANLWIHEYGQEFRRPCSLNPDE